MLPQILNEAGYAVGLEMAYFGFGYGTCCRSLKINCNSWLRPAVDVVYWNRTDHFFFISTSLVRFVEPFFCYLLGKYVDAHCFCVVEIAQ